MTDNHFTTMITVDQSPDDVLKAIGNVRGWWFGDVEGDTAKPGDEFTYRYEALHASTQKIIDVIPGKRIVWRVTDSRLSFVPQTDEWTGTEIVFDITKTGDQTELRFTHVGLTPDVECYDICAGAWTDIIANNLRKLIAGDGT